MQRIVAFVRGRGGVDEEQLAPHIARVAGVRRVGEFMTGARAVIELLTLAGWLVRDGDTFHVSTAATRQPARTTAVEFEAKTQPVEVKPRRGTSLTLNLNLTSQDLKSDAAVDALAARVQRLPNKLSSD